MAMSTETKSCHPGTISIAQNLEEKWLCQQRRNLVIKQHVSQVWLVQKYLQFVGFKATTKFGCKSVDNSATIIEITKVYD